VVNNKLVWPIPNWVWPGIWLEQVVQVWTSVRDCFLGIWIL